MVVKSKTKPVKKRTSAASTKTASKASKSVARTKPKLAARKRVTARVRTNSKAIRTKLAEAEKGGALTMKDGSLVVSLARDSHPEIFEIDDLVKQVQAMIKKHNRKQKMRDLRDFLLETEKSLQIILSNHLEVALRKYLK